MKFSIFTLSLLSILLFSCGTSNKYIADDIYVLKPSDLPIGESSADETSYAAFKKRKDGPTRSDQQLYADQFYSNNYNYCLAQPFWYEGCGCSYATWSQRSRYSNYNLAMNQGYYYNPYYGSYYMIPPGSYVFYHNIDGYYGGYGFGYNHYGGYMHSNMYGYNNPYAYYNGYGNYNGYGYYNGYGGNGYYNGYGGYGGSSSNNHVNNFHNGPRGTSSGYSNPNGRQAHSGPVKTVVNNSNSSGNYSKSTLRTSSETVRKPIETINTVPNVSQRSGGTITREGNVTNERTYQRSNEATSPNVTRQPSMTREPSVIRDPAVTRDPATRTPNAPIQRQSTSEPIQRSNQNNGATRSPENNSTPRTNTNTGRRP